MLKELIDFDPTYGNHFKFSIMMFLPRTITADEAIKKERLFKNKLEQTHSDLTTTNNYEFTKSCHTRRTFPQSFTSKISCLSNFNDIGKKNTLTVEFKTRYDYIQHPETGEWEKQEYSFNLQN